MVWLNCFSQSKSHPDICSCTVIKYYIIIYLYRYMSFIQFCCFISQEASVFAEVNSRQFSLTRHYTALSSWVEKTSQVLTTEYFDYNSHYLKLNNLVTRILFFFIGQSFVVREGLTSPWIPRGWTWGGSISSFEPHVADFKIWWVLFFKTSIYTFGLNFHVFRVYSLRWSQTVDQKSLIGAFILAVHVVELKRYCNLYFKHYQ